MPEPQPDWLATRLATAMSIQPVAECVALAIETQVRGEMSQRKLRPTELDTLALSLLELVSKAQDGNGAK
jgi:hypothetical protein